MSVPLDPLARSCVSQLFEYVPGKPLSEVQREFGLSDLVKIASNENPLGPSPKAVAAMQAALPDLWLYPDNGHRDMKQALSAYYGVPEEWLAVGAGGTPLLKFVAEAFVRPGDRVVFPWPSFQMYPFYAQIMEAAPVAVPLTAGGQQDVEGLLAAARGARLVFLCNPNNPSGTYLSAAVVEEFLARVSPETLVVLDEAYFEYARDAAVDYPDGIDFVRRGHRLLVLRTLSKVYGLAGLRVACLIGHPGVIRAVRRVREPFHVSSLAQVAAIAALSDREHLDRTLQVTAQGRRQLEAICAELGLEYIPSVANYVFMNVGHPDKVVSDALLRHGVIVRPVPPPTTWLRVTVGTAEQNERFGRALAAVLAPLRG